MPLLALATQSHSCFTGVQGVCQGVQGNRAYYGPLLGWAYVMGKQIKYFKEAQQVIPGDMTFTGPCSDYVTLVTDGLKAVKAVCQDFGLKVEESEPCQVKSSVKSVERSVKSVEID